MAIHKYQTWAIVIPGLFVMAGVMAYTALWISDSKPGDSFEVGIESPETIETFNLVDQNNNRFTRERLSGHWSFVFFGFTNCPDVCPATLMQLKQMNKTIKQEQGLDIAPQFIFVSVDPERDKQGHLAEYIRYFDPDFVGLTGEIHDISRFEKQFDAFHRYGKKNASGFYTVEHSSEIYLLNPDRKLVAKFLPPMDIKRAVQQLSDLVRRYNSAAV